MKIIWPVEILQNKYAIWYELIISRSQLRTLPENTYTEKHHIIPRSMGGSNRKSNLAILTAREHFICHRLLTKFLTGRSKMKMSFATWIMMTNNNPHQKRYKVTSRIYEFVKQEMVAFQKTDEYRKKISDGMKNNPNKKPPWNKGKKGIYSPETTEKMRLGAINMTRTPESIAKGLATKEKNGTLRKPGMWSPSPEARKKISESLKGKVPVNKGKKMSKEDIAKMKESWTPERRKKASESRIGKSPTQEHLDNLKKAQTIRRQRETEEKNKKAFCGPIRPNDVVEYRGAWYDNMNCAARAYGISRGMVERQINAFGNSPSLEVCKAIDNKTIKWPRSPIKEETKRKISQAQVGKKVSFETRKKQSEKAKGRIPWNKGKSLK